MVIPGLRNGRGTEKLLCRAERKMKFPSLDNSPFRCSPLPKWGLKRTADLSKMYDRAEIWLDLTGDKTSTKILPQIVCMKGLV